VPALGDVMGGEWIKLRSLRSTKWTLGVTALLVLGFSTLAVQLYAGRYSHLSASDRADLHKDPISLVLQPGMAWGVIAVCVLAALTVTSEYSTGAIRSVMLAVPARRPVILAKAAVIALVTFALGEVLAFVAFFLSAPVINRHVQMSLTDGWALRAVLGSGVFLAATAVLAFSVAALVRNTAGGITAAVALVFVAPNAVGFLPGRIGDYVSMYLPGGEAGQMILTSGRDKSYVLGPWAGILVAVGWAVLALLLATAAVRRRDV
jgi:ABC-type transport system involved in multi-copper enzyme maturation permease subunit